MSVIGRFRGRFASGSLARDSAWGLVQEGMSLISVTISFTLLGRALGPERYGGFQSVFATVGPFVTMAATGTMLALIDHAVRRQEDLREVARSSLSMSILLGALLSIAGTFIAVSIVDVLPTGTIILIAVGEFMVAPIAHIAASTIQAGYSFPDSVKIRLVAAGARVALVVGLFALDSLDLTTFVVCNFIAQFLVGLGALYAVGRRLGFRFVPGRPSLQLLRTNFFYSVNISADSVQNDADKSVLAANKFVVDTGLYAAAYRVVQMGLLPLGAFMSATHTRVLQQVEDSRRYHLRLARRYTAIIGSYSLVVTMGLILAAPLISLVLGDDFNGSVQMTRWLAPLIVLRCLTAAPMNGLLGLGRNTARSIFMVSAAAVSVGLYLWLIPEHGWKGAAIATCIAETINAAGAWILLYIFQRRHDASLDAAEPAPLETAGA